ncbi:universal stress protein [Halorubrum sp. DTA98]|uniref:universal stress protein n=1 Tax=Halorubrum sp. DTA98 TaxID=3402163 RepID=UPI003AAB1309
MVDTVLVAMDDSPLGREALAYALDTFPDARIVAAHVAFLEFDMLPTDTEEVFEADPNDLGGVGDETAQSVFATIRETAGDRPVAVSFLTGEPDDRLVEYVESEGFDEVVLGTHGREGVSRLLIGSVAESVVRRTDVPTTLVK